MLLQNKRILTTNSHLMGDLRENPFKPPLAIFPRKKKRTDPPPPLRQFRTPLVQFFGITTNFACHHDDYARYHPPIPNTRAHYMLFNSVNWRKKKFRVKNWRINIPAPGQSWSQQDCVVQYNDLLLLQHHLYAIISRNRQWFGNSEKKIPPKKIPPSLLVPIWSPTASTAPCIMPVVSFVSQVPLIGPTYSS